MDLIERTLGFAGTLSDGESKLNDFLSTVHTQKELEDPRASINTLKSAVSAHLVTWEKWHKQDPTYARFSKRWATATAELVAWEKMYAERVYQPAHQLGIELAEPQSWLKSHVAELPPPFLTDYPSVGEEICIDRRWEVATFCKMLKRESVLPQRILAFQISGGKGKTILLRRFEKICEWLCQQGEPLLYGLVDFRNESLTPHELVYKMITTMQMNAKFIGGHLLKNVQPLETLHFEIRKSKAVLSDEKTTSRQGLALREFAHDFVHYLSEISLECTVVLMLDTFERAGETGEWFLNDFLPLLRRLDKVIVVLSGRAGLDTLGSSDVAIFRDTLEPLQYVEDCQQLAALRYRVHLTEEQAKRIITVYRGDVQSIDLVLKVMTEFPQGLSTLTSATGG